jgi:DNA replication and repair protein RecF
MHLDHLWLTDFLSYRDAEFSPAPDGITVVTGANAEGKTNLLEAIGYLATLRSFRGSPAEVMVRAGAPSGVGVVRAEGFREARRLLVEAELHVGGRGRVQFNGQPLRRSRDLVGAFCVTVFVPDDLDLVKGGPHGRRQYLDDLLVALYPRHDVTLSELERVLKQRNALLKSAGAVTGGGSRSLPADVRHTLEVWDLKLSQLGEELVAAREVLTGDLQPLVNTAYQRLAEAVSCRDRAATRLSYQRSWEGDLRTALDRSRGDDVRRGVTSVGPHRDELLLEIGGLSGRTHASQGEQRSLVLALRLAGHQLVTGQGGSTPILLLDDVFSELDSARSEALLSCLPDGQAIVTAADAAHVPSGAEIALHVRLENGKLLT